MNRRTTSPILALGVLAWLAEPAFAHHLMGGRTPTSFAEGILSGLGHPVIGLDHFAAVVAVGCLAAAHRQATALVFAFVLAMMAGVAAHVQGTTVPGAEILVAVSVIVFGALLLHERAMTALPHSRFSLWLGWCNARLCARRVDLRR